jgi:D-3-phosphoglycerate dehydrogenase
VDGAVGSDPAGRALLGHGQVIATPHIGGSTQEAVLRTGIRAAENLVAVLEGTPCRHVVNPAAREEEP